SATARGGGSPAVARAGGWGGEEFVRTPRGRDLAGAVGVAERTRAERAGRVVLTADGEPIRVTASFGVAVFPDAATAEELLAAADGALYQAKDGGQNRVAAAREAATRP